MTDEHQDNSNSSEVSHKDHWVSRLKKKGVSRRLFLKGVAGTAPVIITLANKPALGGFKGGGWKDGGGWKGGAKCWSGKMSGNASMHGDKKTCSYGRSPGFYKNNLDKSDGGWPGFQRSDCKGYDGHQGKYIDPGIGKVYTRSDVTVTGKNYHFNGLDDNGTLEGASFYRNKSYSGGYSRYSGSSWGSSTDDSNKTVYENGLIDWFNDPNLLWDNTIEGTKFKELFEGGYNSQYADWTLMQVLWQAEGSFEFHAIAFYFNALNFSDYVAGPEQALKMINSVLQLGYYQDNYGHSWSKEELKEYFASTYN